MCCILQATSSCSSLPAATSLVVALHHFFIDGRLFPIFFSRKTVERVVVTFVVVQIEMTAAMAWNFLFVADTPRFFRTGRAYHSSSPLRPGVLDARVGVESFVRLPISLSEPFCARNGGVRNALFRHRCSHVFIIGQRLLDAFLVFNDIEDTRLTIFRNFQNGVLSKRDAS